MVLFPFNLSKHLISQLAEVRAFRDVLAYQPVCVLVCTPLPGVVRTCEIEFGLPLSTGTGRIPAPDYTGLDDEPPHGPFHLVGELQVVPPYLHPPLILLLSQLPSVPVVSSHVTVPTDLTAYRTCTDPDHFSYLPQAHWCLQQRIYRISLLLSQMLVSHPLSLFYL